jgi:small subunit ribosomal protein S7
MPRKKTKSLQREIAPDRKYNSVLVQRLINKLMIDGKKQLSERLVYSAMESSAAKLKVEEPLEVVEKAFKNITPAMEVKSRRVGGANYQIPFEVRGNRATHLAMMWFAAAARSRRKGMGKAFDDVLAAEFMDAYNGTGSAVKKKEDVHKMADANRAFAHFARY